MDILLDVKSPVTVNCKTAVPCLKYQNDWSPTRIAYGWRNASALMNTTSDLIRKKWQHLFSQTVNTSCRHRPVHFYTMFASGHETPSLVFLNCGSAWSWTLFKLCCVINGHSFSCHLQIFATLLLQTAGNVASTPIGDLMQQSWAEFNVQMRSNGKLFPYWLFTHNRMWLKHRWK